MSETPKVTTTRIPWKWMAPDGTTITLDVLDGETLIAAALRRILELTKQVEIYSKSAAEVGAKNTELLDQFEFIQECLAEEDWRFWAKKKLAELDKERFG